MSDAALSISRSNDGNLAEAIQELCDRNAKRHLGNSSVDQEHTIADTSNTTVSEGDLMASQVSLNLAEREARARFIGLFKK